MELVGVDDDGDFCCIKVHRAVVLRSVVSPLDLDCLTVVFPDTSVTVLQAIVTLFYEGIVITSQHITSEVLATIKNLGIDPDQFSKVGFAYMDVYSSKKSWLILPSPPGSRKFKSDNTKKLNFS